MPCSGCSEQRVGDAVATRLQAARARPQTTPSMSELPPPPSTPRPRLRQQQRQQRQVAVPRGARERVEARRVPMPRRRPRGEQRLVCTRARRVTRPVNAKPSCGGAAARARHTSASAWVSARRHGECSGAEVEGPMRAVGYHTSRVSNPVRRHCLWVEGPRRGAGRVARACAACAFPCMTATSSAVSPVPFFCSMSAPAASNVSHAMALPDAAAHSSAPASRAVRRRRWRDADLSRLAPGYLPRLPGCLSRLSPSAT